MAAKKYKNWGDVIYWAYANLNMCLAAQAMDKTDYDLTCWKIRMKHYKAYREGTYKIHTLYANTNWKTDWGKDFCWYCGASVEECGKLTTDHIFPKAKGGDDSFDNIAYCCQSCNSSKSTKDLIRWSYETFHTPPLFGIVCIYMKLVHQYSLQHDLLELHAEDLAAMNLPFDPQCMFALIKVFSEWFFKLPEGYW